MRKSRTILLASLAAAACICLGAAGARADAIRIEIEPSSAAYVPGGAVDFDVRLTGANNLGSYNIEVLIEDADGLLPGGPAEGNFWLVDLLSDTGNPADPADLNIATRSENAGYVFGANTDATTRVTYEGVALGYGVGLSDYGYDENLPALFYGADTDPDKQVLATFRVETGPRFAGTLRLSFDADFLFVDDPDGVPVADLDPIVLADYELFVPIVPEPATVLLLAAGAAGLLTRRQSAA